MDRIATWPGSVLDQHMLIEAIGKFLRTHKGGGKRLLDWLESVPPDRTEEEYRELKRFEAEEHKAGIQSALAEYNARERALSN